jgi:hypothetical protein
MDDGMSATELRQRYDRGGSVRDCDLSAAQLRSRYAIPTNSTCHAGSCSFGTRRRLIANPSDWIVRNAAFKEEKSDGSMVVVAGAIVALVILAGAAYMLM